MSLPPSPIPSGPDAYTRLHANFRWAVPKHFNIARVCSARWAERPDAASRVAIITHQDGGPAPSWSYGQLQQQANRLSNALVDLGVQRGDRVAVVLPQRFETAVAYMALLQMGAVLMPLSTLFGPEALEFRLRDSGAVLALCDAAGAQRLRDVRAACPQLRQLIAIDGPDCAQRLARQRPDFSLVDTLADEAAVLIYTSGTTGDPKGALIPHRALIGNLSGFVCSQNWFGFDPYPTESDVQGAAEAMFWSPADWTWTGGLMDALLPTLYFGRPIVAYAGRFSPQLAFELMQKHGVTHSFLFPTALKAMMKAYPQPRRLFKLHLQAIMSAGEAVGDAVFAYCQEQLGVTVNEMFGQTEVNYIVGNCAMNAAALGRPKQGTAPSGGSAAHEVASVGAFGWPARPGSMGKPYPGHRVAVIDEDGHECPVGVPGDVALNRFDRHGVADPIFFLGYWNNAAATQDKFTGDWCRTGDMALRDADGYLWYQGRADDMFKVAGYRVGPGEIENCLVKHQAVANAVVVPKPDRERGALVKAYVVLAPDYASERLASGGAMAQFDARLVAELQAHVKGRLAPYEYPKEIEFIEALPMTTTGKVQRRVLRLQEQDRAAAQEAGRP